jgi:hypothetical protein
MHGEATEEARIRRLRSQRNLLAALAVCTVASAGLAVPRRLASHRELKAVNNRLVELQAAIVQNQRTIRGAEEQILGYQAALAGRLGK